MKNILKLIVVLLIASCSPMEELPPYNDDFNGPGGFVEYAYDEIIDPINVSGIWDDVVTGFDTVYTCFITCNVPSVHILYHPEYVTEEIPIGFYKPGVTYEERIPGFKSNQVVFSAIKSWETNSFTQYCQNDMNEVCTRTGLPPIADEDHPWCTNPYSNWLLVLHNPNCLCPYTEDEDPLGVLCEWRD